MTAAHYKGDHYPGNDLGLHYTALPPIVASSPYSDQLLVTRKFWSPGANRPSQVRLTVLVLTSPAAVSVVPVPEKAPRLPLPMFNPPLLLKVIAPSVRLLPPLVLLLSIFRVPTLAKVPVTLPGFRD